MTDYQKDPAVTSILEKVDIFVLPVANPDGYVYTQTHVSNSKWPGPGLNILVGFHILLVPLEMNSTNVCLDAPLGFFFSSHPLSHQGIYHYYFRENSLRNSLLWVLKNFQRFTYLLFIFFSPTQFIFLTYFKANPRHHVI